MTKERYVYADFAQIELEDNGTAFDPKYRDYIFRLLKKVHLDSPGLGVGLALCRKIVSAHYGSIRVEPRPGEGTTFTLLLPVQQQASAAEAPAAK
jgi:sigma-B regulation protein RsbU (phosphoserine phosphatase)